MEKMDLQQRVLNLEGGVGALPTPDDWIYITHVLCKTYGWTLDELKRQPIKFVLNCLSKIVKDNQDMKEQMDK